MNNFDDDISNENINIMRNVPVLTLNNFIIFPGIVSTVLVTNPVTINSINKAISDNGKIIIVGKKNTNLSNTSAVNLQYFGVVGAILNTVYKDDTTIKFIVKGEYRAHVTAFYTQSNLMLADVKKATSVLNISKKDNLSFTKMLLDKAIWVLKNTENEQAPEMINVLSKNKNLADLIEHVSFAIEFSPKEKQILLEELDIKKRFSAIIEYLTDKKLYLELKLKIEENTKNRLSTNQKDYYLGEKIKEIKKELSYGDHGEKEYKEFKAKINKIKLSKSTKKHINSELKRLKTTPYSSSESAVIRSYLTTITSLPWNKKTKLNTNIDEASQILDNSHYGMETVKDSILEFLATTNRTKKVGSTILCLVGPPGVGKTSIGESIAKACGRNFERISLGGVSDESEIRGHRKTYIASMPGKIIQKLQKCESNNPLILLDEIDKLSSDSRGDPASALLEVLDPEQNKRFTDNYLEVEFDLSDVLFICTSNSLNMHPALLDRMEIIELSGYTEKEKLNIASRFLLPKQKKLTGMKEKELTTSPSIIKYVINHYTRESGVRGLEREMNKLCRKLVRIADQKKHSATSKYKKIFTQYEENSNVFKITKKHLETILGSIKYRTDDIDKSSKIGQIHGLAWTSVGGELLEVQAQTIEHGSGKTIYTGSLGDVMKESVQISLSIAKKYIALVDNKALLSLKKKDLHIHFPDGATPKDGPSAGVGLVCVMISAILNKPIRGDIALTGEIDIHGNVLPIGGLKEKLSAAVRNGIKTVLAPSKNKRNMEDVPKEIMSNINVVFVSRMEQLFENVFVEKPVGKGYVQNFDLENHTAYEHKNTDSNIGRKEF